MRKLYYLVVLFTLLSPSLKSQNSVLDLFRSRIRTADLLYKKKDYPHAIEIYESLQKSHKDSTYVLLQLARSYYRLNRKEESGKWYFRIMETVRFTSEDKLSIAEICLTSGNMLKAQFWYSEYQKDHPADSRVDRKLEALDQASSLFTDSLSYQVENMAFNSIESDFYPYIVDKKILFLSNRPNFNLIQKYSAMDESPFLEIYESSEDYEHVTSYHKTLNTPYHEGPFCFLDNGNKIIFTRSEKKNKNLILLMATRKGDSWTNFEPLSFNNDNYSVSHPFFSVSDSSLYFASNMPEGYGGTDLYRSKYSNGTFGNPENLGGAINTEGNEMFPHLKGQLLYFSSNGHGGLGGLDIFHIEQKGGQWTNLTNAGFPVNSAADDFSIFYSNSTEGYFSSNRTGGKGKDDIYHFKEIHQELLVKNIEEFNHNKISQVRLSLYESGRMILQDSLMDSFPFMIPLKPGKKYKMVFSKEGYRSKDTTLVTAENPSTPLELSISLERKIKAYIKCLALSYEGSRVSKAQIRIINLRTGSIDTATTNQAGELLTQIDREQKYILVAGNDTLTGFLPVPEIGHKRGSSVTTLEIECLPFQLTDIDVQVINPATGLPIAYSEVLIENTDTGEKVHANTDKEGKCNVKINNRYRYRFMPFCNDFRGDASEVSLLQKKVVLNFRFP